MKNNIRLLIVDDDKEDRALFIDAVKELDQAIECIEINNGEAALEYLKDPANALPSLIFLDLRMPRISGTACLREIKADERLRNIPVYIYTTSREIEESKKLKEMGASYFISKPNNEEEIYFLLAFALEEQLLFT